MSEDSHDRIAARLHRHDGLVSRKLGRAALLGVLFYGTLWTLSTATTVLAPSSGARLGIGAPEASTTLGALGIAIAIALALQVAVRAPRDRERIDPIDHHAQRLHLATLADLVGALAAAGGWYVVLWEVVGDFPNAAFIPTFGVAIVTILVVAVCADASVVASAGIEEDELRDGWESLSRARLGRAIDALERRPARGRPAPPALHVAVVVAGGVVAALAAGVVSGLTTGSLVAAVGVAAVTALSTPVVTNAAIDQLTSLADASPLATIVTVLMPIALQIVVGLSAATIALPAFADATSLLQVTPVALVGIAAAALPALVCLVLLSPARWRAFDRPLVTLALQRLHGRLDQLGQRPAERDRAEWRSFAWLAMATSPFFPFGVIAAWVARRSHDALGQRHRPALIKVATALAWALPVAEIAAVCALPSVLVWAGWSP